MEEKEAWEKVFKRKKFEWSTSDKAIKKMILLLKNRRFKRILDLGCGTGKQTANLAKSKLFVVGSDISVIALSQAQKRLEAEKISNCYLIENDMIKLPFPDHHFDAVISINVIQHNPLTKIKRTVKEIRRVLRKKGLFLVTLPSTKDYKFGIGKRVEKNTYVAEKGVIHHFFDLKSAKELFSGFRIIKIEEIVEFRDRKDILHKSLLSKIKGKYAKNIHWQVLAEKMAN